MITQQHPHPQTGTTTHQQAEGLLLECLLCGKDITERRKDAKFCCDSHKVIYHHLIAKHRLKPLQAVNEGHPSNELDWIFTKVNENNQILKKLREKAD